MSTNRELSRIFDQIASAQELLGANRFKIAAHQRAARLLRDMTREVDDLVEEDLEDRMGQLTAIDGIGKGLAEKILEYLDTGEISEHQELLEEVPPGLFDVLDVPGLGPKAVKLMWDELGIASVDDLKAQLDSPELAALPRMGAKTIENIRKAIAFAESSGDRTPWESHGR